MSSVQHTAAMMVQAQAVLQEAACMRHEILAGPVPRPQRDVLRLVMLDMITAQQHEQLALLSARLVLHAAANKTTAPSAA